MLRQLVILLLMTGFACADEGPRSKRLPQSAYRRTVFLGDSITDGNTYPQLVRRALLDAGLPDMAAINAGIGGNTAQQMSERLDRDVLAQRLTLVTLLAGANDAHHGVATADYERHVRSIAERLKDAKVPLLLLTPCIVAGEKKERMDKLLREYEAALRRIAGDYGLAIAEVRQQQEAGQAKGQRQLAADNLHPNYHGQRMIARAVLDALGYGDIEVPERAEPEPAAGVVSGWKLRPLGAKEALTEETVGKLRPDDSWRSLSLPESEPLPSAKNADDTWLDDFRLQGGAVSLKAKIGEAKAFVGVATITSAKANRQSPLRPLAALCFDGAEDRVCLRGGLRPDVAVQAASLDELARRRGLPQQALQKTVAHHNAHATALGKPPLSGNRWVLLGPAKAYFTTTEGGAAINQQFHVLDQAGQPIPGLYAVGQNGLGGQVLWSHGLHIAWAITSGRLLGQQFGRAIQ
jgi:lysophospholipase L1-like esterase